MNEGEIETGRPRICRIMPGDIDSCRFSRSGNELPEARTTREIFVQKGRGIRLLRLEKPRLRRVNVKNVMVFAFRVSVRAAFPFARRFLETAGVRSSFAVLLLLSAGSLTMAAGDAPRMGPRLVCAQPTHDFGEIENGEEVEHEFILRNEGDESLVISRVHSSCGCTVARAADSAIEPGGRTSLRARFSLKGRHGHQRQEITVHSNDPTKPVYSLFMTGCALAPFTATPDRIFWGNIHRNAESERAIELKFHARVPVSLKKAAVSSAMFMVEHRALEEGKDYEVRVKTAPPLPLGAFDSPLRMETDDDKHREIIIPMNGRVVGDIFAIPDELVLNPDRAEPATHFLVVRSFESKPFAVLAVEPPLSSITADIQSIGASRAMIHLKNVRAVPELDGKEIRIVTDCESMREISIPIRVTSFKDFPARVERINPEKAVEQDSQNHQD